MKRLTQIMLILLVATLPLVGCGGGGDDPESTATLPDTTPNTPLDLEADATLPVVTATGTTTITATVTNQDDGSPLAGERVKFSTTGSATLSASSATTSSTGQATVTLTDSVAEKVDVTVNSGPAEVNVPVYFGAGVQLNPATSVGTADGVTQASLTATVFDADGVVIAGIPVHFSKSFGSALLSEGEVVTNDLGEASVAVTDSVIETATIEATAGDLPSSSADIDFQPGTPANLNLASAPANTTPLSLFGNATITATITDTRGNDVSDNTPVSFAVSGTASDATVISEATTTNGVATTTLSAGNVSGSLTVTATADGISDRISFTVAPSDAGSIEVVSADPEFVEHQGQSGTQTSTITFRVEDPAGNPVADGTSVNVALDPLQLGGGELISDGTAAYATSLVTQTIGGQAQVTFRSGVVSGTVDITATVSTPSGSDISTVAQVTVVSGQADSLHLFTSGAPLNVPSLIYDGCVSDFNMTVGDRYGNPVPDGTNVSFMVEPGCGLIGNSTGFETTTTKGEITEEMRHSTNGDFENPPLSSEPNCKVVAYMPGDEGFQDRNGNGVWDNDGTEPCDGDQGEPFVDANDNDIYDIGELYEDVDGSGVYDGPNGTCETDTVIWREFDYLASGNMTTFDVEPETFALDVGESKTFEITVSDDNDAPPVAGTTLSVTTDAGTLINGGDSVIADTSGATPWTRTFTLRSDLDGGSETGELAIISIDLTYPGGECGDNGPNLSTQISGTINVDPSAE